MTRPIWQWSAVETAAAVAKGTVSCTEVVTAVVDRMRAANPALNAVTVDLGDEAIATAQQADAAKAAGLPTGPLFGVPVTIKENVDQKGQATPNGLPALKGVIAPDDAPLVANLRQAGAIVIGRTNTPELSFRAFTDNPLRGLTLNPWDPDITCGGSSGGAGSAAAAGFGPIGHGNDIGGSLRYPAYVNGVATIRPTLGRVPAYNPSQAEERAPLMQVMSVQGPLCPTVADVRLALGVMAARDPRDPWWVPAPLEAPRPPAPIKVAVTKTAHGIPMHDAVAASIDQAAAHLADAGYAVEAVEPPNIAEVFQLWCDLIYTEMRLFMDDAIRAHCSDGMQMIADAYYEMGASLDLEGYLRGAARRSTLLRDWMMFLEAYPVVLCPLSHQPPWPTNADLESKAKVQEIFRAFTYMSSINLLGLPAAIVPTGLHAGAPIGVQLVGSRYREDIVLDAAQAIEDRVGVLARQLWARAA